MVAFELFMYNYAKKFNIKDIFLGHHNDDILETLLLRKIQLSGIRGNLNIFSNSFNGLNFHRPLKVFTKNQINTFANFNKLRWFEDRTNSENIYTRNKIRNHLINKKHSEELKSYYQSLGDIDDLEKFLDLLIIKNQGSISIQKFIFDKLPLVIKKHLLYKVLILIAPIDSIRSVNIDNICAIVDKSSNFNNTYNNIPEKSNQLNIYNLDFFQPKLFEEIKLKKEDYPFWISHLSLDGDFVYKTQSITKKEKESNAIGPKIIFNIKLNNDIYFKPKWVKNYVTKQKELIVQDNKNILYLVSNDGEIIWEKDILSKIVGNVYQVDLYKNGRLQYAFNTEKSLMILDKNGKEVEKLDHKNNIKVLGLAIFDYDKNKNYRFLICYDNQVKMLDSNMKIVKGFNKNTIKHEITNTPKHFRVGSNDYLVFNTEKKLYITDRRGNTRVKISENLNISRNEIFLNKNSIFSLDNNNSLNRIDLEGKISKKPLPLESKYLISATNNNLIYISENTLTINKKSIELKYGNYSKPIIFSDNLYKSS